MHQNKLIGLLKSFSRREMTRLEEFAHSPYFNKHAGVQSLIAYLSAAFPGFSEKDCQRERIFQALFPGSPHDQAKLALLFTYALRLAEQFLSLEQLQAEGGEWQHIYLLRRLRALQQPKLYERALRQAFAELEEAPFRDSAWHYRRFLLAAEADAYYTAAAERRADRSLELKQEALDGLYLTEKLRDACEMTIRSRILRVQYDNPLADWAVQEVERRFDEYAAQPSIAMYYHLYRMVSESDTARYFHTVETLGRHQASLPVEELKPIYNYLQNYCIQQINQGDERFLAELFKLYQAQLEQGLLLEAGLLSEWHYKNITTTALRLRELDWVRQFIEGYQAKLPPEARDNAYRFNLASYYYAAEQYGEVLGLLTQVEYSDLRYNLGAKALLLRTYYDLEEYEALGSLVDSFKQYLHRNKLMADVRRQGYYNLFLLTRRAAQLRYNLPYHSRERCQAELRKLRQSIAQAGAIFNQAWLLEKVAALAEAVER
jgi:hypothetical protein